MQDAPTSPAKSKSNQIIALFGCSVLFLVIGFAGGCHYQKVIVQGIIVDENGKDLEIMADSVKALVDQPGWDDAEGVERVHEKTEAADLAEVRAKARIAILKRL